MPAWEACPCALKIFRINWDCADMEQQRFFVVPSASKGALPGLHTGRMPPPVIDKCNNASTMKGLMIMCQHVSTPNHANVVLVGWLRGMLTLIPGKSATLFYNRLVRRWKSHHGPFRDVISVFFVTS